MSGCVHHDDPATCWECTIDEMGRLRTRAEAAERERDDWKTGYENTLKAVEGMDRRLSRLRRAAVRMRKQRNDPKRWTAGHVLKRERDALRTRVAELERTGSWVGLSQERDRLRARVAELEAERDAAESQCAYWQRTANDWSLENERLRGVLARIAELPCAEARFCPTCEARAALIERKGDE